MGRSGGKVALICGAQCGTGLAEAPSFAADCGALVAESPPKGEH